MFLSDVGFSFGAPLLALGLFLGMLGALALGRRIARERAKRRGGAAADSGTVSGAVFGLLGLLIAFTFSGAAQRFDARRDLIVREANAIGTAYLRLELVEPVARAALKEKFRRYVDARLATFRAPSLEAFRVEDARVVALQGEIWSEAVRATSTVPPPTAQLLLPALNDMIDITTTRAAALETHPPTPVYIVLGLLALLSAMLAGIGMDSADPAWSLKIIFAAAIALTIYLTLDIEHPRLGLIRVGASDHFLEDVRRSMK